MQPEGYQNNPHTTNDSVFTPVPSTSAQHGSQLYEESVPSHILCRVAGDCSRSASSVASSSDLSDRSSSARISGSDEVTSRNRVKNRSPVHRISEYENAAIGTGRRVAQLGFKVVPSPKGIVDGPSIVDFPNEVLTHILSHLPPSSLSSMSLVNRRFYSLVTTPHAWRIAFSRYFPGPAALEDSVGQDSSEDREHVLLQRRSFCRLSALTSWRSEYILRTRLLRSLARGKPTDYQPAGLRRHERHVAAPNVHAVVTYNSLLQYPVTHIGGTFGSSSEKKPPTLVHAASEQGVAVLSDPASKKSGVGGWGLSDNRVFNHFADLYPGETEWGLGQGDIVGIPNVMDVSHRYGMAYGEGCPSGRAYFLSTNEKRGRFLMDMVARPQAELGIVSTNPITSSVTSVWIAKSPEVLKMTNGLCGMLTASSTGILTAYALGPNPSYDQRFEHGQVTARWALCPGVPIIAIRVDDSYSVKRRSQRRIWIVVLNALGEVFYLSDIPLSSDLKPKMRPEEVENLAWKTGRTVCWEMIEATRRVARPDPFKKLLVDASYTPRSSSDSMGLNDNQIAAETKEIENFLTFKPKYFRKLCQGWDMRRKLEVDFSGDDGYGAGESVMVLNCFLDEGNSLSIRRFTKINTDKTIPVTSAGEISPIIENSPQSSIFGVSSANRPQEKHVPHGEDETRCSTITTEWRLSNLLFDTPNTSEITVCAIDTSTFAQLAMFEDPLLGMTGMSVSSSSASTPFSAASNPMSPSDIPGQRGRYLAIGTSVGSIFVWDIRAAIPENADIPNKLNPIRIIHTESPQISSLALTALYLVHGGNDGLVQAWDPLASSKLPIRTLNSRFSSRARRRLMQADALPQGVGHNFFAAGAIYLDPDPTCLRGVVALGTQIRYWAYSSSAADQYKSNKRRLRYSQRGVNSSADAQRYTNSSRNALMDYILDEKVEMEREQIEREKEMAHLSGRFGLDLLGADASEADILAYACMLSEESYTSDERERRGSEASTCGSSSSDTVAPIESSSSAHLAQYRPSTPTLDTVDEELEPDLAEAIRLSLEEAAATSSHEEQYFAHDQYDASDLISPMSPISSTAVFGSEDDDFELAIKLSLAEQQGRSESGFSEAEFPALGSTSTSPSKGKGKGRA